MVGGDTKLRCVGAPVVEVWVEITVWYGWWFEIFKRGKEDEALSTLYVFGRSGGFFIGLPVKIWNNLPNGKICDFGLSQDTTL